ncbi:peptide chain release factor 2 [Selenomonas sp.]|uniref:peptide chain release factor 2 n=1 Tax=Selenomonas sp. TaxID=2053611 RepID=UPI0025D042D8|nr:peptide chain release factor 2 [Selenomonas sp.]MCI6087088.1 peptide chain release factor 2 [Selenomonas sp.]MCI6283379.1 peptide chain release factor 2 [Selenomonas sp.]MDY3298356.1 peptide chain release factor 2 [Selenomonas sp.]MDY4415453.1 peptide chain release factor 2 [Selenomonas sp.]
MLEDIKPRLGELKEKLDQMELSLEVPAKEEKIAELEYKMGEPTFWDDAEEAQKINQELNDVKISVDKYKNLKQKYEDVETLWEMAVEDEDTSLEDEINADLDAVAEGLENLQLEVLLSGPYDANNAILTLHAGAGGTEAQDWTQMLLRMYGRWAERHGFTVETADLLPGDEAGVKSATLFIKGHNAYGFLKSEKGIHRLVRISPFDANARRHTSFAACDIMPEIDDAVEVDINMADVRVDTYRASGAGGQHINKTSSAVRMTHEPTGIVVQCQNERSQLQNREQCLKMLRAKLFELEQEKKEKELAKLEGDQQKIEWGSQIRSYVFQPYTMVKDHRTNEETGNVQAVMDGDLDPFIRAFLAAKANHEI